MDRAQHLLDLIDVNRPRVITEVGVSKGHMAVRMILRAAKWNNRITYHGFDLFNEGLTDAIREKEFQKNQKTMALEEARAGFSQLATKLTIKGVEFRWFLYPGDTRQTLLAPEAAAALKADFVYLDGGHSVDTCRSDTQAFLKGGPPKVICFDDFFHGREPEFISRFGCNAIVQELMPGDFTFLPVIDPKIGSDGKHLGAGQVVWPRSAWPWARLQAGLFAIRHHKPKTVFVYADEISNRYLEHEVASYGGVITTDTDSQSDLDYIDCTRRDPGNGTWAFMNADEAKSVWDGRKAPIRIFAGLRQDGPAGAGHIMQPDAIAIVGLDKIDGVEVGAFCWPKSAWPPQRAQIHVATRNCVADEVIIANVKSNTPRINKWATICAPHDGRIVLVSGGPSLKQQDILEELRDITQDPKARLVCVKHAHDYLIENGFNPWGCVLLDPRDHVSQFVEHPNPSTIYFTASMVSTKTLDLLLEKNARVVGYHALVGAGEDKQLPPGTTFLTGGTSSAMRGLSLFLLLGFRRFTIFAMDSCYDGKPTKLGEKTSLGYDRYQKVEIGGRKFWTELELIAQAQDFKQFVEGMQQSELLSNIDIEIRGDGIIPHLWSLMRRIRPSLSDVEKSWSRM